MTNIDNPVMILEILMILVRFQPTVQQCRAPACLFPLTTPPLGSIGHPPHVGHHHNDGNDHNDDNDDNDDDDDDDDDDDFSGLCPVCPATFHFLHLYFSIGLEVSTFKS